MILAHSLSAELPDLPTDAYIVFPQNYTINASWPLIYAAILPKIRDVNHVAVCERASYPGYSTQE